jgi:hypothetical protein
VAIFLPMSPAVAVASHAARTSARCRCRSSPASRRRRSRAARGLRGEGRHLRRLVPPARQARRHAGDARAGERDAPRCSTSSCGTATDGDWDADLGPGELPPLEVDSEHPYLLRLHVGTTGRPKGALHVTAASSSRSPARPRTRPTSSAATAFSSRPTWAGSWGRGPSSAPAHAARRSSIPRALPTGRRTASGRRSRRSA